MRIPVELAQTLAAVVDEGSMDAAARLLHLTPSAVSQRIKALEQQVGRVVLARTRPPRVTAAGEPVLRFARQVQHLEAEAAASLEPVAGNLRTVPVAVNADSLATWFLAPLARLSARYPVVFDLHRDDQDFTARLLESGAVLGAVTSREQSVSGCRTSRLGALRYRPVATPEFVSRWLPGGAGQSGEWERAPLVDFDRRDDLQRHWLRRIGVEDSAPPRHYVPASHDFAQAIECGLGWGMLPDLQSRAALAAGRLVLLPGPHLDVPLFWQQWNLRSDLLDGIAAEIIAEGRKVLLADPA